MQESLPVCLFFTQATAYPWACLQPSTQAVARRACGAHTALLVPGVLSDLNFGPDPSLVSGKFFPSQSHGTAHITGNQVPTHQEPEISAASGWGALGAKTGLSRSPASQQVAQHVGGSRLSLMGLGKAYRLSKIIHFSLCLRNKSPRVFWSLCSHMTQPPAP